MKDAEKRRKQRKGGSRGKEKAEKNRKLNEGGSRGKEETEGRRKQREGGIIGEEGAEGKDETEEVESKKTKQIQLFCILEIQLYLLNTI